MFSRQEAVDLYNQGCAAMAAGSFPEAVSFFRQSLSVEPGVVMTSFNLALALQQAGDLAGAIDAYWRCAAGHPEHADSYFNLGCALEQAGRIADAIESYRACLAGHPAHRGSAFNLASCLQRAGDAAGAAAAYRSLLANHPEDADAAHNLGCLLQETGDVEGAIDAYQTGLARQPGHRAALFNLASCLAAAGRRNEAVAAYRACIAQHPDHPDAVANLAAMLRDQGEDGDAIALLRDYLSRHPRHRTSLFEMACLLQRGGDVEGAMAAYRDCMRWHPDHPDAVDNLANLLIGRGAYEEASRILEDFCARHPEAGHLTPNLMLARWRSRLAEASARDAGLGLHRILVACMPKSGSTFLTDVLAKLPGMRRAHLVPDYGRREQEPDLEQLINHSGLSYVSQLHLRPSRLTQELLSAFAVKPVFLFRNIWDVMASLRDHMHSHSLDWSMARIDPAFREWEEGRQYEFLARTMMPWFIDFYVSWSTEEEKLTVRYEELMAAPEATVRRIADWAGLEASAAEIGRALAETGHSATFNKGGSGRGKSVPAAARAHVEALTRFYPHVDFTPLMQA